MEDRIKNQILNFLKKSRIEYKSILDYWYLENNDEWYGGFFIEDKNKEFIFIIYNNTSVSQLIKYKEKPSMDELNRFTQKYSISKSYQWENKKISL